MLIVGIENPQGETHYIAAAFPSACGKTNLAMLIPPDSMPGWKIWTVGDDIAWLHPGPDGRLYAINPEAGYFGVVPGHQPRHQSQRLRHDPPRHAVHQRRADRGQRAVVGRPQTQYAGARLAGQALRSGQRRRFRASEFALHGLRHEQSYLLAAQRRLRRACRFRRIVFGGRRREVAPLVYEARNWQHGVLVGASVASETTAAATGAVGVVRRDPMAMKPFAGYNFGDYWQPLARGGQAPQASAAAVPRQLVPARCRRKIPVARLRRQPARHGVDPETLRRPGRRAKNHRSAICHNPADLNLKGADVSEAHDAGIAGGARPTAWRKEAAEMREYLKEFGAAPRMSPNSRDRECLAEMGYGARGSRQTSWA